MARQYVRACLITNPRSGRGSLDLTEVLSILCGHGWEVDVREKRKGGGATELARTAAQQGYNVVVDCGGDGTLSEIVDGVVGTDIAVGTLPGGTANLWAHEAGISSRLRVAAMQLVASERRRVDVGRVTINGSHSQHFLLVAGLGFDGAVMGRVSKPLKNRIGPLAVGLAALEAVPTFRAVPVGVELDNINWQGCVSQIVLGNSRRYGAFTKVTPDAFMDDGLLDVCIITASNLLSVGRQLTSLALRKRPSEASAETYRAAAITVRSPVVLPLELDGGVVKLDREEPTADGMTYDFAVISQGVSMLVPRTYDGELFQPERLTDSSVLVPLEPIEPKGKHENGNSNGAGHGAEKKWRLRVVSVGADTITGARLKNGRVVKVQVKPATTLKGGGAPKRQLWGALSALSPGDVIAVKGQVDGNTDTVVARKVALEGPQHAAATTG
jgi:YegS/Rv2252/BmrU family lipid kinase